MYWQRGARQTLQSLQPHKFLHEQLRDAFSVADSPIWQDCSTAEQCQQLENAVGGPQVCMTTSTSAQVLPDKYVSFCINKIQQDVTVCRYLFTASLLYMFRASITPIIMSTKNYNCSPWCRSYYVTVQQTSSNVAYRPCWRKVVMVHLSTSLIAPTLLIIS